LSAAHNPHSAAYVARIEQLEQSLCRQTGEITLLQQDRKDLAELLLACANLLEARSKNQYVRMDPEIATGFEKTAGSLREILQRMNLAPSNPSGTGSGPSTNA
jgi:hypothetical protein